MPSVMLPVNVCAAPGRRVRRALALTVVSPIPDTTRGEALRSATRLMNGTVAPSSSQPATPVFTATSKTFCQRVGRADWRRPST